MTHMTQLAAAFENAGMPPTALDRLYLTASEAAAWLPAVDAHVARLPEAHRAFATIYRDELATYIARGAR